MWAYIYTHLHSQRRLDTKHPNTRLFTHNWTYMYTCRYKYTHLIGEHISSCFDGHDVRMIIEYLVCDWTVILTYRHMINMASNYVIYLPSYTTHSTMKNLTSLDNKHIVILMIKLSDSNILRNYSHPKIAISTNLHCFYGIVNESMILLPVAVVMYTYVTKIQTHNALIRCTIDSYYHYTAID